MGWENGNVGGRSFKILRQDEYMSCGPACVGMVYCWINGVCLPESVVGNSCSSANIGGTGYKKANIDKKTFQPTIFLTATYDSMSNAQKKKVLIGNTEGTYVNGVRLGLTQYNITSAVPTQPTKSELQTALNNTTNDGKRAVIILTPGHFVVVHSNMKHFFGARTYCVGDPAVGAIECKITGTADKPMLHSVSWGGAKAVYWMIPVTGVTQAQRVKLI